MNKKTLLAIEIIWFTLGLICLYIAVRETVINGPRSSWTFFILGAGAIGMGFVRDRQRKKL